MCRLLPVHGQTTRGPIPQDKTHICHQILDQEPVARQIIGPKGEPPAIIISGQHINLTPNDLSL